MMRVRFPLWKPSAPSMDWHSLMRRLLVVLACGALLEASLAILMTPVDRRDLSAFVAPRYLLLAVILAFVPWVTNSGRILVWTRFFGKPMRPMEALKVVLGTEIGAACVPLAVGGAPVKVGMLVRHGFDPARAISLTAFTTVEDGLFFLLALPVALLSTRVPEVREIFRFLGRHAETLAAILCGVMAALAALIAIAARASRKRARHRGWGWFWRLWDSTGRSLHSLAEVMTTVALRGKRAFLLTMLLTAVQWTARYSIAAAICWGLGKRIDTLLSFSMQWGVSTLSLLSPTPGASAGAEASFLAFFHLIVPRESLGTLVAAWRLVSFHLTLAIGSLLFLWLQRARSTALLPIALEKEPAS